MIPRRRWSWGGNSFRQIGLLLSLALIFAACAGVDETGDSSTVGQIQERSLPSDDQRRLEPLLLLPGWPFEDGTSQYRLIWSGGDSKLPLFERPSPNSRLLGEVTYSDNDEIVTTGDYTAVYRPTLFRTRRSVTIEGPIYRPERGGGRLTDQRFSKRVGKGTSVAVWMYAGGNQCYLGVSGVFVVDDCPTPEDYIGDFDGPTLAASMQPLTKIWWARITTPVMSGWIPLDDRVIADIFPAGSDPDEMIARQEAEPDFTPKDDDPGDDSVSEPMPPEPTLPESDDQFSERETALFGGGADEEQDEAFPDKPASTSGLGSPLLSDEDIEDRLQADDDPLDLGAFAFMQARYRASEEGSLSEFPIQTPTLLDVYLDARPNPRVRAFVRGRMSTDFSIPRSARDDDGEPISASAADLDQLWISFDLSRQLFVTLGKQRIKWGTGRFWNPTDFLNASRRDPLNSPIFDSRLGVTLAKLHYPVESLGWNFYAFGLLGGSETPEDVGLALRGEFLFDLTEVAVSGLVRNDEPLRAGASLSSGVWIFELRAEFAVLYDDPRSYFRGELDLPNTLPEEIVRDGQLIPQLMVGAELPIAYRRGDLLTLGGEYFYNDAGYPDASLYPWVFANGRFTPFYTGRRYAGAYAGLIGPGSWDDTSFVLTGLANLSDESYIARLDIQQVLLSHLRWNVFGSYFFGQAGEFNYGLEIEPNIFAPDGVSIAQPLFEVGLGLSLQL